MFSKSFSVAVVVSDADRSAKWYKEKLGFETSVEDHWITVWPEGANCKLHLCEGDELEPGNTGIAFYTDDVKKKADELKKNGVKISKEYTKESWGEYAMFDDPDGNSFWISPGEP